MMTTIFAAGGVVSHSTTRLPVEVVAVGEDGSYVPKATVVADAVHVTTASARLAQPSITSAAASCLLRSGGAVMGPVRVTPCPEEPPQRQLRGTRAFPYPASDRLPEVEQSGSGTDHPSR